MFVNYFIRLLWILHDHYLKPSREINIFWLPSIITQSGVKQRLLLTMVLRHQLDFWRMMWYVDTKFPSFC